MSDCLDQFLPTCCPHDKVEERLLLVLTSLKIITPQGRHLGNKC